MPCQQSYVLLVQPSAAFRNRNQGLMPGTKQLRLASYNRQCVDRCQEVTNALEARKHKLNNVELERTYFSKRLHKSTPGYLTDAVLEG